MYHAQSSVAAIMKEVTSPPAAYLIAYSESSPASNHVQAITEALRSLVDRPVTQTVSWPSSALQKFSAHSLAGELARLFDLVAR